MAVPNYDRVQDLRDVDVDALAGYDALRFDAATGKFVNYSTVETGIIDLDDMPPQYTGSTDAEAIQWAVNRLLLTDAGAATERNIVILVGDREYDVTAAAFQETSTPNGGVTAGANAQILIPAVGPIATDKVLTLEFRAKRSSAFGYSVVNGDPTNVMPTNAVIKSDAVGLGSKAMIGASRAVDGYAGLYLSNVIVVFNGVTFRASGGITAFDASYCFSVQGQHFIADTGTPSHLLTDPRRDNAGGSFTTGETEAAFADRSVGLKTPRLYNGGHLHIANVNVQGFRYGFDVNEHLVVDYAFVNYCYAAVKLRVTSHVASLGHVVLQRCPIWFEAPESGDWGGAATATYLKVSLASGEAYHPGEYGNPAGDRWYNHVARIWDPNDVWAGEVTIKEHVGEADPTWPTLPSGHGANLVLHELGVSEAGAAEADFSPAAVETALSGGVAVVSLATNKPKWDVWVPLTENGSVKLGDHLAPGMEGVITVIGKLSSGTATLGWTNPTNTDFKVLWEQSTASGVVTYSTSAPAIAALDHDDVRHFTWRCVGGDNFNYVIVRYVDAGNIAGSTDVPPAPGAPIISETFAAAYSANNLTGTVADTTNTPGNTFVVKSGSFARNSGVCLQELGLTADVVYDREAADGEVKVTFTANNGVVVAAVCNHNNGSAWNTTSYWAAHADCDAGTVKIMEYETGTGAYTEHDSAAVTLTDGVSYTVSIIPAGDAITAELDGVEVCSYSEGSRPGKTDTYVGWRQSQGSAVAQWDAY